MNVLIIKKINLTIINRGKEIFKTKVLPSNFQVGELTRSHGFLKY